MAAGFDVTLWLKHAAVVLAMASYTSCVVGHDMMRGLPPGRASSSGDHHWSTDLISYVRIWICRDGQK
jgi:hypothetical protein